METRPRPYPNLRTPVPELWNWKGAEIHGARLAGWGHYRNPGALYTRFPRAFSVVSFAVKPHANRAGPHHRHAAESSPSPERERAGVKAGVLPNPRNKPSVSYRDKNRGPLNT